MLRPLVSPFWIKSANSALMNFEAGTFNFQLGSTCKINLYLFPRVAFLLGVEIISHCSLSPWSFLE